MDPFARDDEDARVAEAVEEISLSSIARDENPVVRLVNSMLFDALQSRASDIHVESTPEGLVIKYRIDGVLQQIGQSAGLDTAEQALSRLKVLSGLDIGERRVPQDGRFKARIQQRDVDFRVSIMPSIHGEDAVLRVLDKSQRGESLSLDSLGLDADAIGRIRLLASEPYGMLLVTGPTGSGKSTTLYAALSETNTGEKKIITIEDPVEYELPGVLQIPVNDKKGLTLRSTAWSRNGCCAGCAANVPNPASRTRSCCDWPTCRPTHPTATTGSAGAARPAARPAIAAGC